jgi:general secretion pathway protein E
MTAKPTAQPREGRLTVEALLPVLQHDQVLSPQNVEQMRQVVPRRGDERHAFVRIGEMSFQSNTRPSYPVTVERLSRWLAEKIGVPYVRIDPLKIDVSEMTKLVSQAYAQRFQFLPIAADEQTVTVATAEPNVREWEREMARVLKRRIKRVIANPQDIERYLVEFYGVSHSLSSATKAAEKPVSGVANFEQLTQLGKVGEPDANDKHIVHLVDWLLQFAFDQRASDIHVEPRRDFTRVRFRIDGVLHQVHEIPAGVATAITSRIKSLGRMDVSDRRRPQDGRIKTKTPAGKEVELRLSTMPTAFGEKLVLRIFDPSVLSRSFEELGFSKHDLAAWKHMTSHPHGFILVTGPTGSGKTTTLYSALKQLARPEINVCTIEDPIEMVEPAFNQMQVQPGIELDFASGVRTLLRQDPDIIMIGEIRDHETATVAIQAALTGHLVLSTLHTNDAPSAITRLVDIGVQPYLIGATLLGVVAQRLVRTLCPHCKQPAPLDVKAWQGLVGANAVPHPKIGYKAIGCDECRHTGYLGRTCLYEILTMRKEIITQLHGDSVDSSILRETALQQGMRSLRVSGADKVSSGMTTIEEVMTVVSTN